MALQIGWPHATFRAFGRHVEQYGVRFPEDDAIILERGDFPVGIQRYILGRALIASSQVDRLQLAVEG